MGAVCDLPARYLDSAAIWVSLGRISSAILQANHKRLQRFFFSIQPSFEVETIDFGMMQISIEFIFRKD